MHKIAVLAFREESLVRKGTITKDHLFSHSQELDPMNMDFTFRLFLLFSGH